MKTKNLVATAATLMVAWAACSTTDTIEETTDTAVVRFASGVIAEKTRVNGAEGDQWEKGDPIGIYMLDNGTTNPVTANTPYQAKTAGTNIEFEATAGKIYYPIDETKSVDFIAYHPYKAAVTDFSYPVDLATQTSQTAIDLLWAKANNAGNGYDKTDGEAQNIVTLNFAHLLAKLVITVKAGEGVTTDLSALAVTINGMNTTTTCDLKTGTLSAAGNTKAIAPAKTATTYEAILLPVTLGDSHTINFAVGGETYTWVMKDDIASKALAAGNIYKYTITLTKYDITAQGTIAKWNMNSGTGTAN